MDKIYIPNLQKKYTDEIVPALKEQFGYTSVMQTPRLQKIVLNSGVGQAIADKKLIEVAQEELTQIAGQKAIQTISTKDISNFKLRRGMPIGVKVTLRRERMYEFLERLISVALPRILGITEQIIFPEIDIDKLSKIMGLEITFVTSASTDEEGAALLKSFGIPFKNDKK
jgi:large subunit ribosomal protein L5